MNVSSLPVSVEQCHARFNDCFDLHIDNLSIQPGQHTVILGANGSGKSALGSLLAGQGELLSGKCEVKGTTAWVSVTHQQALLEAERQKDCADILDILPEPTLVREILFDGINKACVDPLLLESVLADFSLQHLLSRPFRALSTGETRKLLLCRALIQEPDLLILDEPFDGLDVKASLGLSQTLGVLASRCTLVFVLNRLGQLPDYCQQIILVKDAQIIWRESKVTNLTQTLQDVKSLLHMQQFDVRLPDRDADSQQPPALDPMQPLVKFTKVAVKYSGQAIFQDLDWHLVTGQHWQVSGPNGSGKTCLLNLITGDHPQCYNNDILVFGFQRGSGESIWQIKQYIGYMSNALHLDYRVNCSALQVILSGFYDSIGLYQGASTKQVEIAQHWLQVLGLNAHSETPFSQLSFGDQRLLLIARAMVKHPALLILDEPCNGLDEMNRLKVLALIELLAKQGQTTLLYVNHHAEDHIPSIQNHLSMLDYT